MALEGLAREDFFAVGFCEPELSLALGENGAGEDGVDADVVGAEFVGEGAGEADDGGLGGDVDGEAGGGDHPGDGAHVNDGAALAELHAGSDGLSEEEVMFEVDCDELVPEVGGDGFGGVAGVVSGVVDEDVYGGELGEDGFDAALKGGGVGEVAAVVCGAVWGL